MYKVSNGLSSSVITDIFKHKHSLSYNLRHISQFSDLLLKLYFMGPKAILSTIPHINSETNPPPSIINVVYKYLRQFLGTKFAVATLPIYYNIE